MADDEEELATNAGSLFAPVARAPSTPRLDKSPTANESAEVASAAAAAAPDDFGIRYQPSQASVSAAVGGGDAGYRLQIRDEIDREADALQEVGAGVQPAPADDDEFDWDGSAAAPAPAPAAPPQLPRAAAKAALPVVPPPPLPAIAAALPAVEPEDLSSAAERALAELRRAMAAEVAAEEAARAAAEAKAAELGAARSDAIAETMVPALGKPLEVLSEGEEGEEEEEEEEVDAGAEKPVEEDGSGTVGAGEGADGSAAQPDNDCAHADGAPLSEEASLEAEFAAANEERAAEAAETAVRAAAVAAGGTPAPPPRVTFAAAADALMTAEELLPHASSIQPEMPDAAGGGLLACFARLLGGRPALRPALVPQRDAIFCLAKVPYRGDMPMHGALLATLYTVLTRGKDSRQSGASWQDIGFQRDGDFSTDLRGGGMLGPLNVLATAEAYPWLVSAAFSSSRDPVSPFPFLVQSINFTAKALQAMRLGKLTDACNAAGVGTGAPSASPVLAVFQDFYASLLLAFMDVWAAPGQAPTISRIGHIMVAVVDAAYAAPAAALASLRKRHAAAAAGNLSFGPESAGAIVKPAARSAERQSSRPVKDGPFAAL